MDNDPDRMGAVGPLREYDDFDSANSKRSSPMNDRPNPKTCPPHDFVQTGPPQESDTFKNVYCRMCGEVKSISLEKS